MKRITLNSLARSVWQDFFCSRRQFVICLLCLKIVELWLIAPIVSLGMSYVLSKSGHIAISNQDILAFSATLPGIFYFTGLGTATVFLILMELSIIQMIAHIAKSGNGSVIRVSLVTVLSKSSQIIQLSIIKLAVFVMACAPFALLAYLVYQWCLSKHDINYYLAERPPEFWFAAAVGLIILAGALGTVLFISIRWSLALPIMLFENKHATTSLRASCARVRGATWRIGAFLAGWLLITFILGIIMESGFQRLALMILDNMGERPLITTLLLLLAQAALLGTWSFITLVGAGLITRQVYLQRSIEFGISDKASSQHDFPSRSYIKAWWLILAFLIITPFTIWGSLSHYTTERPPVAVTAHRGHSRAAPENTISSIRKAIESGAEFAEIDVLQSADGIVLLHHDRDLKRVSGDSRLVRDVTYSEIRKLDAGAWFSTTFRGEHIPTLDEVMKFAKGKIKLNIEIKFYGPDSSIVQNVVRLIRDNQFEQHCIVTTFNLDALQEVKRLNPAIQRGLIIAHAIGDVSKLDVDIFSVRADWLTDRVLHDVNRNGKEVHVWTVNNPTQAARLIKRGVDNILTSDPDIILPVRNEWAAMEWYERLLLASRLLLGLDP